MNTGFSPFLSRVLLLCIWFFAGTLPALAGTLSGGDSVGAGSLADNRTCLGCHDDTRSVARSETAPFAVEERPTLTAISPDRYAQGVHGRMRCIDCHDRIRQTEPPHQTGEPDRVACAGCHAERARSALQGGESPRSSRGEALLRNSTHYRRSIHACPNPDNPDAVNATCHECHDSHFFQVPADKTSPAYGAWRSQIHTLCGSCHEESLEAYRTSIHAVQLLDKGNLQSATCTDCHAAHGAVGAHTAVYKLLTPDLCGGCHEKNLRSYRDTYHGQVTRLGYAHTAKCFDCHESHRILSVQDAKAGVHPDNRLQGCRKCHDGKRRPLATAGFATFSPHAHTQDFDRYPQMWIVSRFMTGLFWSVLLFFWCHALLWYYRAWRERSSVTQKSISCASGAMETEKKMYFQRFSWPLRLAHLLFALAVMGLLSTGLVLLRADTAWAPVLARGLGGVARVGMIHRLAAILLSAIFVVHVAYTVWRLLRDRTFDWFGPDSLLPLRRDFAECRAMFQWFFGRGAKPRFDRWTYYEKFDYWAVFWGILVMGSSGMVLAFPHLAGQYLPGWVLNVAQLLHGEEAVLAAVFLFTVHFFNNHFRPEKLPPPDIVMFTGRQSLAEWQRDHPAQYARLLAGGQMGRHGVDAPTPFATMGAKWLGGLLIAMGVAILFLLLLG